MGGKHFLILFSIFLINILTVLAQHGGGGGTLTLPPPNQTEISPLTWIIFAGLFGLFGLLAFWLFKKDKKKF